MRKHWQLKKALLVDGMSWEKLGAVIAPAIKEIRSKKV